jgi:transcriptional regulator with XRE-family HTH domain
MIQLVSRSTARSPVGTQIREWRQRRHLSQLDLAGEAEISTRHLSYVETGRATPSREMVMRLAERLDVPLRERNTLLVAAGYAPMFPQRAFDDPALAEARRAVDTILKAHEPNPALALDRHWQMVAANRLITPLLAGLPDDLLRPPVNVLRLCFDPRGLAPRIVNLGDWAAHLLARLARQCEATADPAFLALHRELKARRLPARAAPLDADALVLPLRLRVGDDVFDFLSTTMVFGTPLDVMLSEIAIETFFPANPRTAQGLAAMAAAL